MTSLASALILLLAAWPPGPQASAREAPECVKWQECRDLALEARENGDFERFHDLAWRAMQARRARDPELMYLLARAQSLSGRPGDAIVMLRRIGELNAAFDALTHEDLARVRALPGWSDTRALLEAAAAASPAADAKAPADAGPRTPAADKVSSTDPKAPSAAPPAIETSSPPAIAPPLARFPAPRFVPGGLAYDAVSKRFIVGNLPARKLTVIGEGTNRTATLAGAEAALFDVRSIAIDRREGDLWVVSADCKAAEDCRSALHKLQLISGRVLALFEPADGGARLLDVVVAGGGVLVLDGEGPRLLKVPGDVRKSNGAANGRKAAEKLSVVMDLPPGVATSLAASPDGAIVYVAYRDRIVRVLPASGAATPLSAASKQELGGFDRLRWDRGALVGLRALGEGTYAVIRMTLTRAGTRVRAARRLKAPIEDDMRPAGIDLANGELYYLLTGGSDAVIRAVPLK